MPVLTFVADVTDNCVLPALEWAAVHLPGSSGGCAWRALGTLPESTVNGSSNRVTKFRNNPLKQPVKYLYMSAKKSAVLTV